MCPLLSCFSSLISSVYGSVCYIHTHAYFMQYPAAFVPLLYARFLIRIFATFYVTIVVFIVFVIL